PYGDEQFRGRSERQDEGEDRGHDQARADLTRMPDAPGQHRERDEEDGHGHVRRRHRQARRRPVDAIGLTSGRQETLGLVEDEEGGASGASDRRGGSPTARRTRLPSVHGTNAMPDHPAASNDSPALTV